MTALDRDLVLSDEDLAEKLGEPVAYLLHEGMGNYALVDARECDLSLLRRLDPKPPSHRPHCRSHRDTAADRGGTGSYRRPHIGERVRDPLSVRRAGMSDDERYEAAQKDAVAKLILTALHQQDARTYNGNTGDIGGLALTAAHAVRAVLAVDVESLHCPGAPRTGDEIYNDAIATAALLVRRGEQQ